MKKSFLAVCMGIVTIFAACFATACNSQTDNPGEEPPAELQDGTITFEDATCESIINQENSGTVAIATASNGAPVTYSMSEEESEKFSNAFEGALTISPDGTIAGSYDELKSLKVDITASAEKCPSVTAEIKISVVNPYLTYAGKTLVDAREGIEYAASVALVENSADVTYSLKGDLPAGLSMDKNGTITGVPTEVGPGEPFSVTASAKGYSATTAEFIIDVVINHVSEAQSKIVKFESEETVELTDAFIGDYYVNQSGIATGSALNNNNITYKLAEGSTLPEGFTLYPNGALFGSSEETGEFTFEVIASAHQCPSVSCTFSLNVKATMVQYASINGTITKGEETNYPLNTAVAADGVKVTYSMTEADAKALKDNYGLTVTEEGYLTGVPTKVVEQMNFKVTASAEGYTESTVTMYFRINEPLQTPANGRFEAEYTDLTGKAGTGWSASPTGKNLIDYSFSNASGGAFLNYLHNDTITIEFVIWADEALSNVPLYLCLGSEIGNVTFTPSVLGVYTYVGNTTSGSKTTVNYGSVTVSGGSTYTGFSEYKFGSVNLAEGWNVIQIAVHTNTLRDGLIGGPGLDYIRLDTSAALKWVPYTFNTAKS